MLINHIRTLMLVEHKRIKDKWIFKLLWMKKKLQVVPTSQASPVAIEHPFSKLQVVTTTIIHHAILYSSFKTSDTSLSRLKLNAIKKRNLVEALERLMSSWAILVLKTPISSTALGNEPSSSSIFFLVERKDFRFRSIPNHWIKPLWCLWYQDLVETT